MIGSSQLNGSLFVLAAQLDAELRHPHPCFQQVHHLFAQRQRGNAERHASVRQAGDNKSTGGVRRTCWSLARQESNAPMVKHVHTCQACAKTANELFHLQSPVCCARSVLQASEPRPKPRQRRRCRVGNRRAMSQRDCRPEHRPTECPLSDD